MHPNIDASHTTPFGYVPRVVWEGVNTATWQDTSGAFSYRSDTAIFTALRIDSGLTSRFGNGWTNYAKFYVTGENNHHPSVRVFATDSVELKHMKITKFPNHPPAVIFPNDTIDDVFYDTTWTSEVKVLGFQPAAIGWYAGRDTLLLAKTLDGLPNGNPPGIGVWAAGRWGEAGTHPTLEINGRTNVDWVNQRALYLTRDAGHVSIPLVASFRLDPTLGYGQLQIVNAPSCGGGGDPRASITLFRQDTAYGNSPGSLLLLPFHTSPDVKYSGRVVHTDTLRPRTGLDTVLFIMTFQPGDTADLTSFLGPHGALRYHFAVRSAATDSVLRVLDSMHITISNKIGHADTMAVWIGPYQDSLIYYSLSAIADNISDVHFGGLSVNKLLNGDHSSDFALGKRTAWSSDHPTAIPRIASPLLLDVYPDPFSAIATVKYVLPVEDGDDVVDVKAYDIMMNDVSSLLHGVQRAGAHEITLDGSGLPAGRYLVAIRTRNHQESKLMILTR